MSPDFGLQQTVTGVPAKNIGWNKINHRYVVMSDGAFLATTNTTGYRNRPREIKPKMMPERLFDREIFYGEINEPG